MVYRLTEDDKQTLHAAFPSLNCEIEHQQIWGTLKFACSYHVETQTIHHDEGPNFIQDDYEVRIDYKASDAFGLPLVYEESGVIEQFAEQANLPTGDLHLFVSGACCLGIDPMYQYTSATQFIYDKVIPFFYWQSFRRNFGREPWRCYSHNTEGIFEAITLKSPDFKKRKYRKMSCLCGSGKKYQYCCLEKDKALWPIIENEIQLIHKFIELFMKQLELHLRQAMNKTP